MTEPIQNELDYLKDRPIEEALIVLNYRSDQLKHQNERIATLESALKQIVNCNFEDHETFVFIKKTARNALTTKEPTTNR